MIIGAVVRVELVELMLREITDFEFFRARQYAAHRREAAGQQLHQRRLAVAVGADERDAIVVIDAQIEAPQHRLAGS